jgi:hypothetical protein
MDSDAADASKQYRVTSVVSSAPPKRVRGRRRSSTPSSVSSSTVARAKTNTPVQDTDDDKELEQEQLFTGDQDVNLSSDDEDLMPCREVAV